MHEPQDYPTDNIYSRIYSEYLHEKECYFMPCNEQIIHKCSVRFQFNFDFKILVLSFTEISP